MKKILPIFLLTTATCSFAQQIRQVKASELQEIIIDAESPLTIFNFWATWCGPCIKEIPYFEEADQRADVKVYLVSLDFKNQYDKVEKFVAKKQLGVEVLFLDEKNPDTYMAGINPKWSGAIPATLFVTNMGRTFFYERAFEPEELKNTIQKHLQ